MKWTKIKENTWKSDEGKIIVRRKLPVTVPVLRELGGRWAPHQMSGLRYYQMRTRKWFYLCRNERFRYLKDAKEYAESC